MAVHFGAHSAPIGWLQLERRGAAAADALIAWCTLGCAHVVFSHLYLVECSSNVRGCCSDKQLCNAPPGPLCVDQHSRVGWTHAQDKGWLCSQRSYSKVKSSPNTKTAESLLAHDGHVVLGTRPNLLRLGRTLGPRSCRWCRALAALADGCCALLPGRPAELAWPVANVLALHLLQRLQEQRQQRAADSTHSGVARTVCISARVSHPDWRVNTHNLARKDADRHVDRLPLLPHWYPAADTR